MKVSNFTPDNGGFSTLRVIFFWSLLALGRFLLDRVNSFVSRSFDIVIVGCGAGTLAPRDVTFEHIASKIYFPTTASRSQISPYVPPSDPW